MTPDDPEALEQDVRELRRELDATLRELDRRRHELTDWRLQLRRHWRALLAAGLLAGGTVALIVYRKRVRERPLSKVRRMRRALARMIDNPDAVARDPGVGSQVLTAAAKPAAAGLVGRLFRR